MAWAIPVRSTATIKARTGITAGYGYDKHSERLSYGLQGGILAHADGVTLSQPLGKPTR